MCYQHKKLNCIVLVLWEAKDLNHEIVEESFEQQCISGNCLATFNSVFEMSKERNGLEKTQFKGK